ncbi:MAG: class I adenylate-forming enzyme family protein [Deltaproteobacteria bacterium]|nr:class I adenylate-forming enzyme family protein [Deltaproteobacteria bacterium]
MSLVVDTPHAWVRTWAADFPHRLALASPTARLSYRDLDARVDDVARVLLGLGVRAGERVLSSLALCPAAAVTALAVQRIGAVSVELSRDFSDGVQASALRRSGAQAVVIAGKDAARWQQTWSSSRPRVVIGVHDGPLSAAPHLGHCDAHLQEDGVVVSPTSIDGPDVGDDNFDDDAAALVLLTSGSSGAPLGVVLSSRNLAANARAIAACLELSARDHAMCVLPLSYAYGRSILHSHLVVGGSVFLDPRSLYPRLVMETLADEHCTNFSGVPVTYELLRRQVIVDPSALTSLRFVTQAGGAMSKDTTRWVRTAFAPAPLIIMYGATEATARLSWLPPSRAHKEGSIGLPIPGVSFRLIDDDGAEVKRGGVGHLVASGNNVALGYLDDSERAREVFRDGALWTGDLARVDEDGCYFLVGRAREMLKIAGHRTSPAEIEEELTAHDAIVEAAVIGQPDEILGDVPVALIVVALDSDVDDDVLRAWLRRRLPSFKIPRAFARVPALPRGPNGKVQRGQLRALFAQIHQSDSPHQPDQEGTR